MKLIYSAIQPTSQMTLGNYLGSISQWINLQDDPSNKCIFAVANLHAMTVRDNIKDLYDNTLSMYAQLLSCGVDPKKTSLYIQSQIKEHSELTWMLSCNSYIGEMSRMTQFKEKSANQSNNSINMGLLSYPILMASDILLFNSEYVPVGQDQKQHLEIARDIAIRVNNTYKPIFTVPKPLILKQGAKIMSLKDPLKKMSKSDQNKNATIYIMDSKDEIINKLKKSTTDSLSQVKYDIINQPGISNLISIYSTLTNKDISQAEECLSSMNYGQLKMTVAEKIIELVEPIQKRYDSYMKDKDLLNKIIDESSVFAKNTASETIKKAYSIFGIYS